MRRFIVFLLPTLVVLVATSLVATVLRRERLDDWIERLGVRERLESTKGTVVGID